MYTFNQLSQIETKICELWIPGHCKKYFFPYV